MDKKLITSLLLDFYGQLLSEKQFEIMDYYYNDDLSLREISEIVGITRQGVHDTIKRGEQFLDELETKLGLYNKWQNVEAQLKIIEVAVTDIHSENNLECHSVYIADNCNKAITAIGNIKNKF
ncbi:MAG: YlxM family DNA-binding protein [Acutalibacteraceae bacterium]|nr:YlxM family DNA-binding protein [Acutalibacteraceae bacterium]